MHQHGMDRNAGHRPSGVPGAGDEQLLLGGAGQFAVARGSHDGNVPDGMGHQHIPSGPQGQCRLRAGRLSLSRRAFDGPHPPRRRIRHRTLRQMAHGRRTRRDGCTADHPLRIRRILLDLGEPRSRARTDCLELDMVQKRRRKTMGTNRLLHRQDARLSGAPSGNALLREPLARRHAHALGSRRRVAGPQQHVGIAPQLHGGAGGIRPSDRTFSHPPGRTGAERQHHRHFHVGQRSGAEFPPAPHQRSARHQKQPLRRRHPHALHHPLAGRHHAGQGGRRDRRLRRGSAALALRHRPGSPAERLPIERRGYEQGPVGDSFGPQG